MLCLKESSRMCKFAKSVLRMVFKSLESFFLKLFQLSDKVKELEIVLRPSHMYPWLSKT